MAEHEQPPLNNENEKNLENEKIINYLHNIFPEFVEMTQNQNTNIHADQTLNQSNNENLSPQDQYDIAWLKGAERSGDEVNHAITQSQHYNE